MASMTEMIRNVYDRSQPVRELSYDEGVIKINGVTLDGDDRSFHPTFGIPKSYFEGVSPDLKQRMLRETTRTLDPDAYRVYVDGDRNSALGVFPTSKVQRRLQEQFLSRFEPEGEIQIMGNDVFDPGAGVQMRMAEFQLSDSLFFGGVFMRISLFGITQPSFYIRFVRQICTNGMVQGVGELAVDTATNLIQAAFFEGCLNGLRQLSDSMPVRLEDMQSQSVSSVREALQVFDVPKTVHIEADKWIKIVESGDDDAELPIELLNTRYGAMNAVTAGARKLALPSRVKVEAHALDYVFAKAA